MGVATGNEITRVEYKPISVRELLIEMKNLSELMIDLAYSAVLFNDTDLAEEVLELEEKVDYLGYLLLMNTALAVRDGEDAERMSGIIQTAMAADKMSNAAADIARTVLLGIEVHDLIKRALRRGEERLVRVKVAPNSILVGRPLRELKLQTEIGVDIIAIRRGKRLIIDPGGDERIREEDAIIARGTDVGTEELRKLAQGILQKIP